jgi:hypothetical protein
MPLCYADAFDKLFGGLDLVSIARLCALARSRTGSRHLPAPGGKQAG